ncbi:hypothetical protein cypCar_00034300 [Cyprinus carpio]|nr:hypothetical protein cypCar_00034300 [Cyprinus carpio]
MAKEIHTGYSPDLDNAPEEHGINLNKRQSRVTVKYNRKQLQKRLDVERWIDEGLDKLYEGKVSVLAHPHRFFCKPALVGLRGDTADKKRYPEFFL